MNARSCMQKAAILALTLLPGLGCHVLLAGERTSIVSAGTVYTTSPHQLVIKGTGFGTSRPVVAISGFPALVLSYTNTVVTVQIPAVVDAVPGTYVLTLDSGPGRDEDKAATLDITLGAVVADSGGATGPQGVQGPVGATGAQGLTGLNGATGAKGSTGPAGVTGPQGLPGVPGLQGPAGTAGANGVNGVNGALLVSTVTIRRADMLALNQLAITLLPASPGVVNLPLRIAMQQNNAFYTSVSQQLYFAYGSIASPVSRNSAGFVWGPGFAKYLADLDLTQLTNKDASFFTNQPFIVYAPDAISEQGGSGGDVTFTVWYTALTVR
jgi:hypothetical protein